LSFGKISSIIISYMKTAIKALIVFFGFFVFFVPKANALTFDLIAPTDELIRGQDVDFTINIDTEGKGYSSTVIGMTYDTQYLEYVSASPGTTFSTVTTDVQEDGKLVLTGSSTTEYSGSGSFAIVTFQLIAQEAGSTQICALYNPATPTATPAPTSPPAVPTAMPTSGSFIEVIKGLSLGLIFVGLAAVGFVVFNKI